MKKGYIKAAKAKTIVAAKAQQKPIHFHLITLFPESFSSYLGESILARAAREKLVQFSFYNPRDMVKPAKSQKGKARPYIRIDDKPYGGGPGMVMQALPIIKAVEAALKVAEKGALKISSKNKKSAPAKPLIVFLSPTGEQFTNTLATTYTKKYTDIIIICGRYEGIDARIKKVFKMVDISVGPFVTTGGELPAMLIIDAVSRHVDGVLGNFDSREESRVSTSEVYTRPEVLEYKNKKYKVPKILLSGDHAKIEAWKMAKKGFRIETDPKK